MRASYTFGEAWCVVHGDVLVVLDRGLDASTAVALHGATSDGATAASLRDEPLALAVLEPVDEGWLLWRRRGVPAVAAEPLPDRSGEEWGSDLLPTGSTVAFGAVAALADALPVGGGVVRASAVRVELVAPPVEAGAQAGLVRHADLAPQPVPEAGVESHAGPQPEPVAEPVAEPEVEPVADPEVEPAPEPEVEPAPEPEVEPAPEPEVEPAPERQPEPAPQPAPTPDPQPTPDPDPDSDSDSDPASAPAPVETTPPTAPEQAAPDAPTAHPGIGGIIDSVPGYIRPAAVVEVPDLVVGDHDGMTIAGDAARSLAAAAREQAAAGDPVLGPATGPVVLSSLCAAAHVNPPGATTCACGAPIERGSSDQRSRPEFAELVLDSGERVPLGRGVVLGRRPSSRRVEDGRVPRLVTVSSPSEDISRSHLEVRCEDWNVLAVDLDSTNGTVLLRDGAAPMRLRPGAPQLVAFGDRLDLGDGVVVRIERAVGEQTR